MRAEQARQLAGHSKAMQMIKEAAFEGKHEVDIPIEFLDRKNLKSLGFTVTGGDHQRAKSAKVSWENHWRN